tara:strand:+ start:174 stop:869 length:696 start_codon:yes stop_codon:yes gene_type:complete
MKRKWASAFGLGIALGVATWVSVGKTAPLKESDYYTNHSLGCILLQECKEGVEEVLSVYTISSRYDNPSRYDSIQNELHSMLISLHKVGVKVYIAPEKYFPVGHRGVYHTVSNNFYLNDAYMGRPSTLMSVMRHEGWHAAQDCMAGTINNSMIAIIMPEEAVPQLWAEMATRTYKHMPKAIPWEKEATWAGKTEGMTQKALKSCAKGTMWSDYEPTPLTREWLVKNGYLAK